ncbi:hypothetical protein [Halomonas sp. 25-S5]|uniref:hypothetical protein n=1 Tax=Halomonas sp. 25-S5 TaxID=2994065 RepID=UPI0024690A96|nr:hypothetical protein [Halomonas sp. 25-S5]
MNARFSSTIRAGLSAAVMLPTTMALAHTGHGAPSVHAHTGSPSMLVVLGIVTLGVTSAGCTAFCKACRYAGR